MPIEGVVGQPGGGHDIGDPRAGIRATPPHLIECGIEEPADLAGVFGLPFGHRLPGDPPDQP